MAQGSRDAAHRVADARGRAGGGEPMSCQLIEDYDLVDYPELPEDHHDFYKRNTLRMEHRQHPPWGLL